MSRLPPPSEDAARRAPVWAAWSSLYLDTVRSPAMQEADARALAGSEYGLADLRRILWEEVHPACCGNLFSTAGEWAFFGDDWLCRRILAWDRAALRWPVRLLPGRKAVAAEAERLLARAAAIRAAPR